MLRTQIPLKPVVRKLGLSAVAGVVGLNRGRGKGMVRIEAAFNEGTRGQPLDTVSETTVREFVDSLSRYRRLPWLTYAPIYVAYPTLPDIVDTAIAAGGFDALVAAVQAAGLEGMPTEAVCKEMGVKPNNLWVLLHQLNLTLPEQPPPRLEELKKKCGADH